MTRLSFTELISSDVQSHPCLRWILKAAGNHEYVFFCTFDNLFCTHQALLGNFRKRFYAPYLGILYFSFHLESLDLLPYFVSMIFSFFFGFSRLRFSLILLKPTFWFNQFLLARCISLYFCKQVFDEVFLYNLWKLLVEIKNC